MGPRRLPGPHLEWETGLRVFDAGCGCADGGGIGRVPAAEVYGHWRVRTGEWGGFVHVRGVSRAGDWRTAIKTVWREGCGGYNEDLVRRR